MPAAPAPVGAVPLLGGVAVTCRHLTLSHLVLVSPGVSLGSNPNRRWWRPQHRSYDESIVLDTWLGGPFEFIWCSPQFGLGLLWSYARRRR